MSGSVSRTGLRLFRDGEQGMTLIETLVALGIIAAVAVVFLIGMTTSSKGVMVSQERVAVDSLAKSQMERIKSWQYDPDNNPPQYEDAKLPDEDIPDGYDIVISTQRLELNPDNDPSEDDNIQSITVTVTHDEKVFTLVGYKVKP